MNWVQDRKISSFVVLAALVAAYATLFLLGSPERVPLLFYAALLLTLLCPVALLLIWLTSNRSYGVLMKTTWTSILIGLGISVYTVLAGIWAGGVVNEVFEVSPGHFPVTLAVMTAIYFFNTILFSLASWGMVVLVAGSSLYLIWILFWWKGWKTAIKQFARMVMAAFLVGTVLGGVSAIDRNKHQIAKMTAGYADFNVYHRCAEQWPITVSGVVFLGSGKVLAALPDDGFGSSAYHVLACSEE